MISVGTLLRNLERDAPEDALWDDTVREFSIETNDDEESDDEGSFDEADDYDEGSYDEETDDEIDYNETDEWETEGEYLSRLKILQMKDTKKALTAQLLELEEALPLVKAEHAKFRNRRAASTSRLPDEILCLIFDRLYQKSLWEEPPTEWVLSCVSTHWREVAHNVGSLWATIYLSTRRSTEYIEVYIKRSKSCPLSVTFDICNLRRAEYMAAWTSLVNEVSRWHRLYIFADRDPSFSIYVPLEFVADKSAALLEEIRVELEDYGWTEEFDHPEAFALFGGGAPRLRVLEFDGFMLHACWPVFNGITTLFIHELLPEAMLEDSQFQDLFKNLPSLTSLSLYGDPLKRDYPRGANIVLTSLRALRLRLMTDDLNQKRFPHFWEHLTAPALKTLYLFECRNHDVDKLSDCFTPFPELRPIFPSLRLLVLEDCQFSDRTFEILALEFPSVEHLVLH